MFAPHHPREADRLACLDAYAILDTPRDARFDRLVFMAAQIVRAPVSMVSFVASERQWFKAVVGVEERETTLENSFCPFALLEKDFLIVEDAREDPRFAACPVVSGPPFVRFYAGVPIRAENGLPLGTICVVDTRPRKLKREQVSALRALARDAENMLSLGSHRIASFA